MKMILLFILMLSCKYTTGQTTLLTASWNPSTSVIQPINASIGDFKFNRIESFIAADLNKRLYGNIFFMHQRNPFPSATSAYADFMKRKQLFFNQTNLNKSFHSKPANNTLNTVAELTGSVLDMFLQQYSIDNRINH